VAQSSLRQPIANKAWCCASRSDRRTLIVATAMELLDKQGECAVTMRNIASNLGVGTMTLYTYVKSLDELRYLITQHGFELLNQGCKNASTLASEKSWRGGAENYLRFAIENPNLYNFMFSTPVSNRPEDEKLIQGGFNVLLDKVRDQLRSPSLTGPQLEKEARIAAGRFWVALHGLATLTIAGRTHIITDDTSQLLEEILKQNSPS
jgi:AcrR family transcriptional regulator